jgi:serine/threonine protein kinase/tetratricopeptide (TPR) repeat protein
MPDPGPTINDLAGEALKLDSPDAQRAYLDAACGGDSQRRAAVEQRLEALKIEQQTTDPGRTVLPAFDPASLGFQKGDRIGHYRLIEILGQGGFGVVWRAEQTEPVRREVALKVIKPGMDSQQIIARFEAERQALALMDHPCIAKVFDGGATGPESGRPNLLYFVMELVKGEPITEFADRNRFSIDERLELFAKVCDALQHAHTKGLVHRDLKPSNIMAAFDSSGRSVPKVIDFGVAKALNQRLAESAAYTQRGQLIGTPEYMSPEQAAVTSQDVDSRSDIYSLGVVLHELLTGLLPFDASRLRQVGLAAIHRVISEGPVPKPSTRLSDLLASSEQSGRVGALAEARRTTPKLLVRCLRSDLDWMVLRCLEKNPRDRYSSAEALGADLQRHLAGASIEAQPPGLHRQVARAARDHKRVAWVAIAAMSVCLVVALGATGWAMLAIREREDVRLEMSVSQQQAAEQDERVQGLQSRVTQLDALTDALADAITRAYSGIELQRLISDLGVLEMNRDSPMMVRIRGAFSELAHLLSTTESEAINRATHDFEDLLDEERYERRVLEDRWSFLLDSLPLAMIGPLLESADQQADPMVEAGIRVAAAHAFRSAGDTERAREQFEKVLFIREQVLGPDDPNTLEAAHELGEVLVELQDWSAAKLVLKQTFDRRSAALDRDDARTVETLLALSGVYVKQKQFGIAISLLEHWIVIEEGQQLIELTDLAVVERLASVYATWEESEPGQGYDAKAAEWRSKLPVEESPNPAETDGTEPGG